MVLVHSVIRRLPNSLCPLGRMHGRTHGCKGSLLKVRGEKYKGKHGGVQVEATSQERVSLFFRCFKNLRQPMGRGEQGDSCLIVSEWGEAWVVPGQVSVVPEPSMVNGRCNIFLSL
jgi:hypothetical protein